MVKNSDKGILQTVNNLDDRKIYQYITLEHILPNLSS